MSLPSLYQLTDNMLALLAADDVTDEQIESAFGAITEKSNHICHFLADLGGEIDKFKAEEKRISDRRKAMENKEKRLREYIKETMLRLGAERLEAGTFTITLSPSQGSLEITDAGAIPAEYKTVEQVITIDKAAVKKALADGVDIEGAAIVPGYTLRIK